MKDTEFLPAEYLSLASSLSMLLAFVDSIILVLLSDSLPFEFVFLIVHSPLLGDFRTFVIRSGLFLKDNLLYSFYIVRFTVPLMHRASNSLKSLSGSVSAGAAWPVTIA